MKAWTVLRYIVEWVPVPYSIFYVSKEVGAFLIIEFLADFLSKDTNLYR